MKQHIKQYKYGTTKFAADMGGLVLIVDEDGDWVAIPIDDLLAFAVDRLIERINDGDRIVADIPDATIKAMWGRIKAGIAELPEKEAKP